MNRALPAIALLTLGFTAAHAQNVYYNGRDVDLDNSPYMYRGTLMVPARDMGDRIGAQFDRDDSGRRMWWTWQSRRATYVKGEMSYDLNGRRVSLPTASEARRDVLFVPVEIFRGLTDGHVTSNRGEWERGGTLPGQRRPPERIPPDRRDDWDRRDDDWRRRDDDWRRTNPGTYGRESVVFDRRELRFDDRNEIPYRKSGVLMVPFREMGDQIGARTDRTADGLRVTINFGGDNVVYDKGHVWYRLNGDRRELQTVSEDRNGVLFVPVTLFEAVTRGRVRAY
ncbi:MAG: stalk domain-containing protein [Fimbriimonas sp.]